MSSPYARVHVGSSADPKGRPESDFYETPEIAIRKLLDWSGDIFRRAVWEPACGAGAIVRVLEDYGHIVAASDLYKYDEYKAKTIPIWGVDFLGTVQNWDGDIITNPPFHQSLEFAQHGLKHLKNGAHLALFNRLVWLESEKRKQFFLESPLEHVLVFSKRLPMMHRPNYEGKKIGSGTIAFAWYIWHQGYSGPPKIDWL